jgi:4-hydroxy-2-oxoheptanedioate aldolase
MREMANKLKKRLQAGKACVNGWLAIPSGFSAETMAQCGWDSITVDMQHGVQDYHSMIACFQAMERHPVTCLVRVPWNEPGIIGKVLDGGAWGVICPMVNNAAEAKALVSYALYPPKGKRSNGPIRAGAYGEATPYQSIANDEVLVIPMIETQEAIDNVDEILDVPGISGIYIGPSDLGLSLGLKPMLDREEPQILAIYDKLLAATKKRNLFAGLHNGTAAYAAKMIDKGFRFITIANDSGLMAKAAREAVQATRKAAGDVAS